MRGSRNVVRGGLSPTARKQLNLFYSFTEGVQWLFQRELKFSKVSEGVQHFPGGGSNFFQGGGVQILISIETHIPCDCPRGTLRP